MATEEYKNVTKEKNTGRIPDGIHRHDIPDRSSDPGLPGPGLRDQGSVDVPDGIRRKQ